MREKSFNSECSAGPLNNSLVVVRQTSFLITKSVISKRWRFGIILIMDNY